MTNIIPARGLDVSGDNQLPGRMRYDLWRGMGFAYVIIEACRGDYAVPHVAEHRAAARAAGLMTGIYCYLRPNVSANAMLARLAEAASPLDELPVMFDWEAAALAERVLWTMVQAYQMRAIIYTNASSWLGVPQPRRAAYSGCRLLVAGYPFDRPANLPQLMDPASVARRSNPPPAGFAPLLPEGWPAWWGWQHTGHGRLPGYDDDLDLHVCSLSEAELRASLGLTAPALDPATVAVSQAAAAVRAIADLIDEAAQ